MDRELADMYQQILRTERDETEPSDPLKAREAHEYWERMFGERVRQWRQARNWKQEDLAAMLRDLGFEMHQTTVAKLEKGSRPLRVAEASAIASIFGVPALSVFLGPPPEGTPWPIEKMQESLGLAEQTLEMLRHQMHDSARRYVDQQAAVFEAAKTLNDAALDAERREIVVWEPPSA